ncbi:MAG: XRE family transcriptional regulator, partial [Ruminococcus sp.]
MDYNKLGKILQDARNNLGIKQVDVANKLGCTAANVSSWERGKSKIDIDSFAELCDMYKLDFAKVLEEISNNDNEPKTDYLTSDEKIHIKKYRTLDEYGKKAVDDLLDNEYERCQEEKKIEVIQLPMSELKVSAGTGNWIEDNRYGTIEVVDTPESRKADLVIEINGNSMEPTYHNGDNVLVR